MPQTISTPIERREAAALALYTESLVSRSWLPASITTSRPNSLMIHS
ncbi:hypothetical protein CH61_4381 (plasmid) [Yersinia pestis]|nr:hypothetical protein CH61_4381 [Yersinia pestis]